MADLVQSVRVGAENALDEAMSRANYQEAKLRLLHTANRLQDPVHQERPEKLPGIRQAYQRKQANLGQ